MYTFVLFIDVYFKNMFFIEVCSCIYVYIYIYILHLFTHMYTYEHIPTYRYTRIYNVRVYIYNVYDCTYNVYVLIYTVLSPYMHVVYMHICYKFGDLVFDVSNWHEVGKVRQKPMKTWGLLILILYGSLRNEEGQGKNGWVAN